LEIVLFFDFETQDSIFIVGSFWSRSRSWHQYIAQFFLFLTRLLEIFQ